MSEEYPQRISGFIRLHSSGNVISVDTENYHIQGKEGEWIATDSIIIDGKQFFLMEHQVYRNKVAAVILDSYGKMVVAECNHQFDDKVKQQIHSYVNKKEQPEKTKKKTSVLKKLREKQIAIAVRSGKPVPKYLEKRWSVVGDNNNLAWEETPGPFLVYVKVAREATFLRNSYGILKKK